MLLVFLPLLGCTDKGLGPDALCAGEGDQSVVLGTGAGSEFVPLLDGDEVGLDVAPQGGFGVSVRASTTGLKANSPVSVLLETELDGELSGSFLNEAVQLYCQDDGSGLLWGVVVGFDSAAFRTADDLLALDGEQADLVVEITDEDDESERSRVTVTLEVGR